MSFYFNAKYGLFTYAQCGDLDPFDVVCLFSELGAECIIGREEHQDGGTHLHAFAAWEKKFRSRRTDIFDVGGFHPNVVPSRGTPEGGYDYATKDGDIVGGGLERPNGSKVPCTSDAWATIINAESRDEFWRLVSNWLLEVLPAISTLSETTPNGSTEKTQHHTSTQPISALTRETFLSSMNGYNTTWRDIHVEVSDACGWPSTVSAWPAGTAPTGHPIGDPTLMGQCPSINIH